jgi:hypothetical protein
MRLYDKYEERSSAASVERLREMNEGQAKMVALYNEALEPHGYRFIQLGWQFTVIDVETFEALYWDPEEPLWEFDPEIFIDMMGRDPDVPKPR